jgi:flagellar biosynthetic protein FliP
MKMESAPSRVDVGAFGRHYLEMVLAMAAGMMVYAMAFGRGMAFTSYGDEAVMAAFMTAPMVAWMRYRGHGWRQCAEMATAMLVPTAVVVVALVGRNDVSGRAIGMASHAAMLLGMLALMVARRAEYARAGHCHRDGAEAVVPGEEATPPA